jgi:hypothetical protein
MILHLPSELTSFFDPKAPVDSTANGMNVEVALQMKLNKKLSFQGVSFDGISADISLARVTRLQDILASHKTDVSSATYLLPICRDEFIAHMVELVS